MSEEPYVYRDENIEVIVPWQGYEVKVQIRELSDYPEKNKDGSFTLFRVVTNFEVVNAETEDPIEEFEPPIRLKVKYTKDDFAQACDQGMLLRLAYWRVDKDREWKLFTVKKHLFHLVALEPYSGVGVVAIKSWGDPMVAWGA